MLNPSDSIVDWVLKTVPTMGAGWCPPGMLGIGIGGTRRKGDGAGQGSADGARSTCTSSSARGPANRLEELRIELYDKVNALGIGAQGLGGLSTVLDVKILDYPTHAASQAGRDDPELRRDAPRAFHARRLAAPRSSSRPTSRDWPDVHWTPSPTRERVEPRHADAGGSRGVEARRDAAAQRQDAHRPRRRAQAHRRHARARRAAAGRRFHAIASSTTSARSIRCATKSSAPPARRPRRAWTSSPR